MNLTTNAHRRCRAVDDGDMWCTRRLTIFLAGTINSQPYDEFQYFSGMAGGAWACKFALRTFAETDSTTIGAAAAGGAVATGRTGFGLFVWCSSKIRYPVKINPIIPTMIVKYLINELIFKTLEKHEQKNIEKRFYQCMWNIFIMNKFYELWWYVEEWRQCGGFFRAGNLQF